jgi:hypothetical protein
MQIRFLHGNYYVLLKKITKSRTAASIVNEIGFGYIVSSRQASNRKLNQSIPSLVTGPEFIFLSLGIQRTDNTAPVVPLRRFLVGTEIPMWGVNVECGINKKRLCTSECFTHLTQIALEHSRNNLPRLRILRANYINQTHIVFLTSRAG